MDDYGVSCVHVSMCQYASHLSEYINSLRLKDLLVWTSLLRRTIQTAAGIDAPKEHWKALNEVDAVG